MQGFGDLRLLGHLDSVQCRELGLGAFADHVRPAARLAQGLPGELIDRHLGVEEDVSFRRDYILIVLHFVHASIVELVPKLVQAVLSVGVVVTCSHVAFVVGDCEKVVNGLFPLELGDIGR